MASATHPRTKPRKPIGRPHTIDQIIDANGEQLTVAERIIRGLRAGDYIETASAVAGVDQLTVRRWLRDATRLLLKAQRCRALGKPEPELTETDLKLIDFRNGVEAATAEWHQHQLAHLEQLARGGRTVVTVTEKHDANGKLLESTTKTETLPPNPQVIEWRLTRRFPKLYSQRIEVEHHEAEGELDEVGDLADALVAELATAPESTPEAIPAASQPVEG